MEKTVMLSLDSGLCRYEKGAVGCGTALQRKVAGSILDCVIGIFHWHNPSARTVVLVSTQPLIEMSTRYISWGVKAASA